MKNAHLNVMALLTSLLAPILTSAAEIVPKFAIDPASPSIDGNITPDDVLISGPAVHTQGRDLGLRDDFFVGDYDNLNALSYGQDPIRNPLYFSVDRVAVGLPGTAVHAQALPGVEEAAGDVYQTLPPFGSNSLFIDEQQLGLIPGFFGDDLDALELDSEPDPWTYFSIDLLSSTNGFGTSDLANDILVSKGDGSFATYFDLEILGFDPFDDLDALVLRDYLDGDLDPNADPIIDFALFSLSTFSPSTFTYTGNPYIPGELGHLSPADVLWTDFTQFGLWAAAGDVGLRADDELNALDTVPEPGTLILLAVGLVFLTSVYRKSGGRKLLCSRSLVMRIFGTMLSSSALIPCLLTILMFPGIPLHAQSEISFTGESPPIIHSGSDPYLKSDIENNSQLRLRSSDSMWIHPRRRTESAGER